MKLPSWYGRYDIDAAWPPPPRFFQRCLLLGGDPTSKNSRQSNQELVLKQQPAAAAIAAIPRQLVTTHEGPYLSPSFPKLCDTAR